MKMLHLVIVNILIKLKSLLHEMKVECYMQNLIYKIILLYRLFAQKHTFGYLKGHSRQQIALKLVLESTLKEAITLGHSTIANS